MKIPFINHEKLEELVITEKCLWSKLSDDPNSTTFKSVREHGRGHPLYECLYNCDGNDLNCSGYKKAKTK